MARSPSAIVMAARGRRPAREAARIRWEWRIKEVSDSIALTMKQRVGLATAFVMNRVVNNINRPVTKGKGPRGGRVVTDRSVAGEFPKADTEHLRDTIFMDSRKVAGGWEGYIGTPLNYGLILELRMKRSFLVRTLNEQRGTIQRLLTGPIA